MLNLNRSSAWIIESVLYLVGGADLRRSGPSTKYILVEMSNITIMSNTTNMSNICIG